MAKRADDGVVAGTHRDEIATAVEPVTLQQQPVGCIPEVEPFDIAEIRRRCVVSDKSRTGGAEQPVVAVAAIDRAAQGGREPCAIARDCGLGPGEAKIVVPGFSVKRVDPAITGNAVIARTTPDRIVTGASPEGVVANAAINPVIAVAADNRVVPAAALECPRLVVTVHDGFARGQHHHVGTAEGVEPGLASDVEKVEVDSVPVLGEHAVCSLDRSDGNLVQVDLELFETARDELDCLCRSATEREEINRLPVHPPDQRRNKILVKGELVCSQIQS